MLATAWTWADDTTLDLTIREGVVFHNGDPLGPEDVAFTFNYVLTPEARTVTRQNVDWMKSVEVTGPHNVRIHLKAPFPAALEYLAGPTPIFPANYFKKVGLDASPRRRSAADPTGSPRSTAAAASPWSGSTSTGPQSAG